MEETQLKVYLFKAASEEDGVNDTLLSSPVNTSTSSLPLQPQQQQEDKMVEEKQQETTKNATTISTDHGLDGLARSSSSSEEERTAAALIKQQDETSTTSKNVITTSTSTNDRFISLLNHLKIENQLVPVLVFEYLNLENLWRHLNHPDQYAGIILTSPRCVHSITEAIKVHDTNCSGGGSGEWENGLRNKWESKYVFCVGPSTVSTAKQLLSSVKTDLILTGLESHAESLASKIIEVNSTEAFNTPLLYPCGVQRRDVLLKKLADENITCSQCTVYESVKNPSLETALHSITEQLKNYRGYKDIVLCFFSPSGVGHVFQHDTNIVDHNQTNVVAIGPTTKDALEKFFVLKGMNKRVYQCEKPTPESLVELITSITASSCEFKDD